jgi:hypothetical protein
MEKEEVISTGRKDVCTHLFIPLHIYLINTLEIKYLLCAKNYSMY